jgi:hypothetical protein
MLIIALMDGFPSCRSLGKLGDGLSLLTPGQKRREFFLLGFTGRPSTIQPERPAVVLGACSIQSRSVGRGLGKTHSLSNGGYFLLYYPLDLGIDGCNL